MDIRPKEWNLVGLTVEEIDENNVKISYFVNKYLYETTFPITETNKINRISLGTYCNNNVTEENLTNGNALEMPFDILYVGIGEYQHTKESYKGIYNEDITINNLSMKSHDSGWGNYTTIGFIGFDNKTSLSYWWQEKQNYNLWEIKKVYVFLFSNGMMCFTTN